MDVATETLHGHRSYNVDSTGQDHGQRSNNVFLVNVSPPKLLAIATSNVEAHMPYDVWGTVQYSWRH